MILPIIIEQPRPDDREYLLDHTTYPQGIISQNFSKLMPKLKELFGDLWIVTICININASFKRRGIEFSSGYMFGLYGYTIYLELKQNDPTTVVIKGVQSGYTTMGEVSIA